MCVGTGRAGLRCTRVHIAKTGEQPKLECTQCRLPRSRRCRFDGGVDLIPSPTNQDLPRLFGP